MKKLNLNITRALPLLSHPAVLFPAAFLVFCHFFYLAVALEWAWYWEWEPISRFALLVLSMAIAFFAWIENR